MNALVPSGTTLVGPLLTLGTIVGIVVVRGTIPIAAPGIPLLLTVAVAAVLGGIGSGLMSAVILAAFVAIDASAPGALFRYEPSALSRLILTVAVAPTMAVLVGGLASRLRQQDAELAQARAHERDRALTDSATDGVITIDTMSRIRSANPAAHELFGYPAGTLVDRPLTDLIPPASRDRHRDGLAAYLASGERHMDWRGVGLDALHASGQEIPVEVSFAEYGHGSGRRFIGIVRDVRRRRELEEQLRQAQKMDALGQLAGGVAHDFNNILTAVYGFADLVRSELPPGDERRAHLDYVIDAAARGRDLVGRLLAFGRRQPLTLELLDIDDVVASVEPMLRRLIGEHISVTIRVGAGTRAVECDRAQLAQVVLNLALNARDAMPDGGELVIETSTVDLDAEYAAVHSGVQPGAYTVLAISDNGSGMDAATKARIFEPFFTTKPQGQGTGLGLATVHGIVAQTGGRIEVYSEPGRGTTFRVYFPARGEPVALVPRPDLVVPRGDGRSILVVEDEETIRDLARLSLERSGYRVVLASTPSEALAIIASEPVAVLVTDVVMPGGSGVELAAMVRAERPAIPVVFMSGYAPGLLEQAGSMRPGDLYLAKPFSPDELGQAVATALARVRDDGDSPRP